MTDAGNNERKTRGKPFGPGHPGKRFAAGNPGRPKGARHKATVAAEALLDGEAKKLTRKCIEMAMAGDTIALRLCMERLVPPRKDRPLKFNLPEINGAEDHPAALAAVLTAVATGEMTPTEAQSFALIMEAHRKAIETADLAARVAQLEGRMDQ